jgi:oligopeptide transport system substrate-binding protein
MFRRSSRFLFFLLLVVVGCKEPSPSLPDSLRIAFSIQPVTIDPRKCGDVVSSTLICLIYEGLTRCSPNGYAELAIAEKIDISEDRKIYTFHLKKTFWSDGHPVIASDFEKSWKKILDPNFPTLCAYLFYPILNAEAAFQGKKSVEEVGIRSIDENTLEVTLESPTPYFLSLTSFPSFLPLPQHRIQEMDKPISKDLTTNGPFYIEKLVPQSSIVLRKSPTFWNAKKIRLKGLDISIIPNETTTLEMFHRGELDWIGGLVSPIAPDALMALAAQRKLHYFPIAASTFCAFNTKSKLFNNENMRKAFSLAIDREEIASEILTANQIPATRCIPPALCGGKNRKIFPLFNAIQAKVYLEQGLAELGTTIEEISPVTLLYRNGAVDRMIAQVIQRKWKDILGIDIKLAQTDFKTHKEFLHRRNYQVALANWVAQYQDPINILERFKDPKSAKNYPAWDDPEYASLIDQIQDSFDVEERTRLIEKAEDLVAERIPLLPIYHWYTPHLTHPRIHNLRTIPTGGILFEQCWIGEDR